MLPKTSKVLEHEFKIERQPSQTYQIRDGRILGYVDGKDAVQQAVFCILNTERFEWLIYDWGYGVELSGLYGTSMGLVKSKVKKRVAEALMQDDRITGVDEFSFIVSGRRLSLSFCVHTIFGDMTENKELNV